MKQFLQSHKRQVMLITVFSLVMTVLVAPAAAQATVVPIDIDINPLFTSINQYIPMFFAIFAVAGGIAIAIAIVQMVIGSILKAVRSKS